MDVLFREEQKFNQWWVWLILIGVASVAVVSLSRYNLESIGFLTLASTMIVFFWMMKLSTEIDAHEIRMSFFPFSKKVIQWSEIESANVVNYGFVGGWGIRLWTRYGTVYNIRGNKGLALRLKNGKKLLIGTQKEKELLQVINRLAHNNQELL